MICKPCGDDADFQSEILNSIFEGHADCKGCDCAHKPVKAGQIVEVG